MPRTNARAWPKANSNENEIWLDATPPSRIPRDQWQIPGNANPPPQNNVTQQNYYSPQAGYQLSQYQQQQINYSPHVYPVPTQQATWMSLAQYNGHPEQIGKLTATSHTANVKPAWADNKEVNGSAEVLKQELWVDGPTAFRKNIEGLTHNLNKDSLSPTKKHHRLVWHLNCRFTAFNLSNI